MNKPGLLILSLLLLLSSCHSPQSPRPAEMQYASLLKVEGNNIISICPFDNSQDTLVVERPLGRLICMSTSHVAFLDALGCDSVICGISGTGFVSSTKVRERIERGEIADVGYEQAPDYERILALMPDVLLAYKVSSAESPFLNKLKSLGIKVFTLYEFLENHPLGRAEYLKAFGLMTGRTEKADSLFCIIEDSYNALVINPREKAKVLMNIPYGDIWYVPGADSYMSRLVEDAGGEILGAQPGTTESSAISLEEAFVLSGRAGFWLNTGWCRTSQELNSANPLFKDFQISSIYNNTLRTSPGGGNDFWESGYVRPDLILKDLRLIFSGDAPADSLHYYIKVQ